MKGEVSKTENREWKKRYQYIGHHLGGMEYHKHAEKINENTNTNKYHHRIGMGEILYGTTVRRKIQISDRTDGNLPLNTQRTRSRWDVSKVG